MFKDKDKTTRLCQVIHTCNMCEQSYTAASVRMYATPNTWCSDCLDKSLHERDARYHFFSYDDKPAVYPLRGSAPHYGIELEVDFECDRDRDDAVEGLYDLPVWSRNVGLYYVAQDGSLNTGLEVVFSPMGLKDWTGPFGRALLNVVLSTVSDCGGTSYDTTTCGLHVHRSKCDLSDLDVTKLIAFFASCKQRVQRVAQRADNGFADFGPLTEGNGGRLFCILDEVVNGDSPVTMRKYVAVNLYHGATVEFRAFKGTLKLTSLLSYIAFSHYVVEFVRCQSLVFFHQAGGDGRALWSAFILYLECAAKADDQVAGSLLAYIARKRGL